MATGETTDDPVSDIPDDDTTRTDVATEDEDYSKTQDVKSSFLEVVEMIYSNQYYWDIIKSTIIFVIALKVARECNMLRIPMKEYKPFSRCGRY